MGKPDWHPKNRGYKGTMNMEVKRHPKIDRGCRAPRIERERQRPKIGMVQRCPKIGI